MKLTPLELAVLKAIDTSEYGDELTNEIWTFSISDNIEEGIKDSSISGIVSSLTKKDLVYSGFVEGMGMAGVGDTIAMTDEGAKAYIAAVGVDAVESYIDPSLLN